MSHQLKNCKASIFQKILILKKLLLLKPTLEQTLMASHPQVVLSMKTELLENVLVMKDLKKTKKEFVFQLRPKKLILMPQSLPA